MPRFDPYNLRLQISRMFEQGQSVFCTFKVQDWLRERGLDPNDYEIFFHPQAAVPPAQGKMSVEIELRRKDGQPVDPDLQADINYFA
ncbi:hypothetical protein [Synechocystis sp. LKSZ1]|uniref:hypothetical protein n=1 Tax=Synechocystis sp. LKSZ1 TaxID=3144951 RepID=UPI00336C042D